MSLCNYAAELYSIMQALLEKVVIWAMIWSILSITLAGKTSSPHCGHFWQGTFSMMIYPVGVEEKYVVVVLIISSFLQLVHFINFSRKYGITKISSGNSSLPTPLGSMISYEDLITFIVCTKNLNVKFGLIHGKTPSMVVRPWRRAIRRSTPRALPEQVGKVWKCFQ